MRIISFDPSLTNWGIVVWEDGKFIESTTIAVPNVTISGNNMLNRLNKVRRLSDRVKQYEADLFVSELPTGTQNFNAAIAFGAVLGILANYPEDRLITVTPFMLKKFFNNIKPNPDKKFIHEWVKERYPIDECYTRGNHQADAVIAYLVAKEQKLIK